MQPTPLDSWGVEQVVDSVRSSGTPAAFLIKQQKPWTDLTAQVAEGLSSTYSLPVFEFKIPHRIAYAESMFDEQTALDVNRATKAKEKVAAVTDELIPFTEDHYARTRGFRRTKLPPSASGPSRTTESQIPRCGIFPHWNEAIQTDTEQP